MRGRYLLAVVDKVAMVSIGFVFIFHSKFLIETFYSDDLFRRLGYFGSDVL